MSTATAIKTKGPGGRPTKVDAERRCKQTNTRWTIAEKQYLHHQAQSAGFGSVGEFIRRRCLGLPVVAREAKTDARLIHELNAIGVNLNQIARNLNAGRGGARAVNLDELMGQLRDVLDRAVDDFYD